MMSNVKGLCIAGLAAACVVSSTSRVEAGPITITWQGNWSFYNAITATPCRVVNRDGRTISAISFRTWRASASVRCPTRQTVTCW